MNKRKYPPGPEIETIERLMKKRDDLQEENKHLRELLMEVMKAYHEGIESPLEFNKWLRAMDKVYGWELAEELSNDE